MNQMSVWTLVHFIMNQIQCASKTWQHETHPIDFSKILTPKLPTLGFLSSSLLGWFTHYYWNYSSKMNERSTLKRDNFKQKEMNHLNQTSIFRGYSLVFRQASHIFFSKFCSSLISTILVNLPLVHHVPLATGLLLVTFGARDNSSELHPHRGISLARRLCPPCQGRFQGLA